MKEEKFRVIQFIWELILAVDKELKNYPKKELEIKNRIRTCTYDILEIAYEANVTTATMCLMWTTTAMWTITTITIAIWACAL